MLLADFVYHDGDFGGGNACCCHPWFGSWLAGPSRVLLCLKFVYVDVHFCVGCLIVLMAFYPLNTYRSSEFVMKFSDI